MTQYAEAVYTPKELMEGILKRENISVKITLPPRVYFSQPYELAFRRSLREEHSNTDITVEMVVDRIRTYLMKYTLQKDRLQRQERVSISVISFNHKETAP